MSQAKPFKTSIGGQAVIEGVMMRGPKKTALSVRLPDGTISTEDWPTPSNHQWYKRTPFIRGVFNFFDSMACGYDCLMKSAEKSGLEDEEPSRLELWLQEKLGERYLSVVEGIIMVFAVILALGLFMVVPTYLVKMLSPYIPSDFALTAIEGVLKISIFLLYMVVISRMKDIQRVFQYHGAEHKTIFCYERGEALTVENVRKQPRHHPRCGTSFLFVVIVVSILLSSVLFAFVHVTNTFARMGLHILLLPVIVSITYELNRLVGKYDNAFTRIVTAPGLWLQNWTTFEPDDSMIEVGIRAFTLVLPEEKGKDEW